MALPLEQLEAFASVKWAAPYLISSDWIAWERTRGDEMNFDHFNARTIRSNDGVSHWLELYLRPTPGETVQKSVSLIKFGNGLGGFPGICHGGALLTLLDEGLAYLWLANDIREAKPEIAALQDAKWKESMKLEKSPAENLAGYWATAHLDIKFLKPVPCPGILGIEAELVEKKARRMKVRAVMKNEQGVPVLKADGVWVLLAGAPKL